MQLHHIAINNLRRRKARMLFVLLGLSIGMATVVAVYGLLEAMRAEMTRQASEFGANIVITASAGEMAFSYGGITLPEVLFDVEPLTMADVAAIDNIPSRSLVRVVAPKLLGVSTAGGREVIVAGVRPQEEFRIKPWLRLQEAPPEAERMQIAEDGMEMELDIYYLDLARQDPTKIVLGPRQVLLGSAVAAALPANPGDRLTLGEREFVVFGLLKENASLEDELVIMNLDVAQGLLGRSQEVTVVELATANPAAAQQALLTELSQALPGAQITSVRQETLRRDELLTRMARFGLSVSVLILLAGTLVAALAISGAVRERTREIGIFRALGFRQSDVAKIIMLEALIISLGGGILGYTAGVLAARAAGPLLDTGTLAVPWRLDMLAAALLLSVVVGLSAGVFPARQAARLDPAEALRFI
ncbi:MAG: Macrolide export ATP-binding/permease protein MacB [Syntrophomonadaceae bacterium]|nr:Macrolide export ATP-binding/permease protein MacB [Bacillota bacterium]